MRLQPTRRGGQSPLMRPSGAAETSVVSLVQLGLNRVERGIAMKTDLVPVRLGENWILVHAKVVLEFVSQTSWLSVPGSTPLVPGVMTWRGRAIPVLDLPRALKLGSISSLNDCTRTMVVEHSVGTVGIPVSGAREVRTFSDEEIRPPHVSTLPYATGELDDSEAVLPLIEIEQILTEVGKADA